MPSKSRIWVVPWMDQRMPFVPLVVSVVNYCFQRLVVPWMDQRMPFEQLVVSLAMMNLGCICCSVMAKMDPTFVQSVVSVEMPDCTGVEEVLVTVYELLQMNHVVEEASVKWDVWFCVPWVRDCFADFEVGLKASELTCFPLEELAKPIVWLCEYFLVHLMVNELNQWKVFAEQEAWEISTLADSAGLLSLSPKRISLLDRWAGRMHRRSLQTWNSRVACLLPMFVCQDDTDEQAWNKLSWWWIHRHPHPRLRFHKGCLPCSWCKL